MIRSQKHPSSPYLPPADSPPHPPTSPPARPCRRPAGSPACLSASQTPMHGSHCCPPAPASACQAAHASATPLPLKSAAPQSSAPSSTAPALPASPPPAVPSHSRPAHSSARSLRLCTQGALSPPSAASAHLRHSAPPACCPQIPPASSLQLLPLRTLHAHRWPAPPAPSSYRAPPRSCLRTMTAPVCPGSARGLDQRRSHRSALCLPHRYAALVTSAR